MKKTLSFLSKSVLNEEKWDQTWCFSIFFDDKFRLLSPFQALFWQLCIVFAEWSWVKKDNFLDIKRHEKAFDVLQK